MEKLLRTKVVGLQVFAAADPGGTLTLECYDIIGRDILGDGIRAESVSEALSSDAGKKASSVHVRINSPGGDAFEGVAIYNLLRQAGKPVTTIVDGIAASAASIVAMAGDNRLMGEGTHIMIHNAFAGSFGDSRQHLKTASVLETVTASMADIYSRATGRQTTDLRQLMNLETWFTSSDAVIAKFATGLIPQANLTARGRFIFEDYGHVPDGVKAAQVNPEDPVFDAKSDPVLKAKQLQILTAAQPKTAVVR